MTEKTDSNPQSIEQMTFEACYAELQQLVEQFEKGQMPLAESVQRFERGMLLMKRCNEQLGDAEKRVETLLRKIEPAGAPQFGDPEPSDGNSDIPF